MAGKIFISYRREDSAANALSIGQYLENEFGRRNVFIDVDMHAGAKFPVVLEERLSVCTVMIVLIGHGWAAATDQDGNRRLDSADDWVRLEISTALRRGVPVIPVRVSGAELPKRSSLPHDIQGLLDHQAITVTTSGFRNEMAGLVKDIHKLSNRNRYRIIGLSSAAILACAVLGLTFHYRNELLSSLKLPWLDLNENQKDMSLNLGPEWTLYNVNAEGLAQFFNTRSIRHFSDRAILNTRGEVNPAKPVANNKIIAEAGYEDDTVVYECNSDRFAYARQSVLDDNGKPIYDYKWGDPEILDISIGLTAPSGSLADMLRQVGCTNEMREPLVTKTRLSEMKFIPLASTRDGDGEIFYAPSRINDKKVQLVVLRLHNSVNIAPLFKVGLKNRRISYQYIVQNIRIDCAKSSFSSQKTEYYDENADLKFLDWTERRPPTPIQENSPLSTLKKSVCAPKEVDKCNDSLSTAGESPFSGMYVGFVEEGNERNSVQLKLQRNGDNVVGAYFRANICGRVVGKMTGDDNLKFQWFWGNSSGYGRAAQDGNVLTATAGYNGEEEGGGNLTLFRSPD